MTKYVWLEVGCLHCDRYEAPLEVVGIADTEEEIKALDAPAPGQRLGRDWQPDGNGGWFDCVSSWGVHIIRIEV